ncbi:MAG TPA: sialate O-acetylesterase, partial [Anseongella sp.]|nr:sialate O-acetylesterase [Anseongella sp.]
GGLTTTDGRPPDCFYLAGADRIFYKAEARIKNGQVWLSSPKVPRPVALRYAFTNMSFTNLSDEQGLPVAPFRTDDWDRAVMVSGDSPSFSLAPVLQSNMVVQQGRPFRLWGKAPAGDTVRFQASWSGRTLAVPAGKDGSWEGQIEVPAAVPGDFEPHTIRITHERDTLDLSNLLIGEVWLCAGQSNMDMMLGKLEGWYAGVLNYEQEVARADYPAIRLMRIDAAFKLEPQAGAGGTWKICTPETAARFSAVAYFFGRRLFRELNVPVGLIASAVAGASCQAFTPLEVLEADSVLKKKYLDPFRPELASQQVVDSAGFFTKVTRPTLIYNAMIHPLEKLSLRGFVWYQGESNHTEREAFTRLCSSMIQSWRERFKQGDLPFYFTQIAPYKTEFDPTGKVSAFFREAQENLLQVKHTGMAVTMDVGDLNDVHPRDKKPVGERLAALALHKTYGLKEIICQGPELAGFKIKGSRVRLSFVPSGTGLTTRDGKAPEHFFLAGADSVFHPAAAAIKGGRVWLYSEKVKRPVAVRYAFFNGAITNFQNKEGFPALPFRTDNWTQ